MSALLQWLTEPEWSQVVKTLLHSLWQGALIAVALALAMRRVVNPHWRYRFSLLALAAIPVAGIITWATLNTSTRPLPIATPAPVTTEAAAPTITLNQNPDTKVVLVANHSPAPPPVQWTAWLALLWIVGTGVMLGRAGIKLAGAEQLRRSCHPLENAQVTQLLAEARRAVGLARKIRVAVTDKLTSPAVVGVLVPTLILPLSLITTLTPEQIRFILLHELAHIRRGDYFANLFQLFVEALLFFNPAVWWISHQIRREREACCDALAIELSGAPADYARTLVYVAENVLSPVPDATTAFGGKREPSSLADRVQRLLVPGYRPSLRLTWRAMIAAFALGATLLVLSAEGTRVAVAELTKSPTQSADQKETSPQESKPKLEIASYSSMKLNDFKPTSWPLGSDRGTLSGPENLGGMTDWDLNVGNTLPLPALRLNRVPIVAAGDKMPFLGDLPWVGKLFTSSQMKSAKTDFVQLSQLSTLSEVVRKEHNIPNSLSIRFQDTPAGNDLVLAQLDRQNDRPAANDNVRTEKPSRISESAATNRNIHSNAPLSTIPGNLIYTRGEKQRAVLSKLNGIFLDRVYFNSTPLMSVIGELQKQSWRRASDGLGIPIFFGDFGIPSVNRDELAEMRVTIIPPLTNVTLMDALDAVAKGASRPIKFSIEENAVVVSLKGREPDPLFMREFKMDPAVFASRLAQGGHNVGTAATVAEAESNASSIRNFFVGQGVGLEPAAGKSVFYNHRIGKLVIRATKEELDRVEQLVVELNRPEPQVKVKVRFVEVSTSELETFVPDLIATTKPAVPQNWTGNLTESQMDQVLHRLQTNKNISVLSEGEVTTASGRQAQLQTVEIKTIVTGINPKALAPPGISVTNNAASGESSLITSQLPFGSTIDLIPTITADGYSISLTVTPQMTEFLGYGRSTNTIVYENGKKGKMIFPLPQLRTRQMRINAAVGDGATLVLGAAPVETSTRLKEKVPVLGDIPGIGGLFRNESSQVRTNILLVFVTPTIVAPATKRPQASTISKDGNDESFVTPTNLRPVIDYLLR